MLNNQIKQNIDSRTNINKEALLKTLKKACKKIAPLWPLESFVAVNPYLGLTDQSFESTAQKLSDLAGIQSTLPVSYYLEAIEQGKITPKDIESVLRRKQNPPTLNGASFIENIKTLKEGKSSEPRVGTVAHIATALSAADWQGLMTDRISTWAASYFDKGQAQWKASEQSESLFLAWKFEAETDKSPAVLGLSGFDKVIKNLPQHPIDAAQIVLDELDIPEAGLEIYLHSLLLRLGGWSAYIAHLDWESSRYGGEELLLQEFLCVLICWEYGFYKCLQEPNLKQRWEQNKHQLVQLSSSRELDPELLNKIILQEAFDFATQTKLVKKFKENNPAEEPQQTQAKVQAIFCIDVRSEVYRRNLESVAPEIDTLGFAGFFGFPIKYVKMGHENGNDHCPVLIPSGPTIVEEISDKKRNDIAIQHLKSDRLISHAWKTFKSSAVSSFGFVSPIGLSYLPKLFTDSFGLTRPVPNPDKKGLSKEDYANKSISLETSEFRGKTTGIPLEDRIKMAKGALQAMSLTDDFARLVLIVGHGSTTVNNPHATGLDCGACAGQSGEANAKVAAAILNDKIVRQHLMAEQITIPDTTFFIACLHDTTTDEVALYNTKQIPSSHQSDYLALKDALLKTGHAARAERALRMNIEGSKNTDAQVKYRSKDWAQVRPEWGLAGCSAFVVAPRSKTKGINLEGRSFLHSYDWKKDTGFKVLEVIMTAPMIVTSWINLQYYGSTVDNEHFGSGNKTLHNVTAGIGVLEGYAGDLRTGLPMQSIHDGTKYQHEPLRLSVVINAPKEAINNVLEKHPSVKQLCDNQWIFLMAMSDEGEITARYDVNLEWEELENSINSAKVRSREMMKEQV
jgi:hypothetical protein